MNERNDWTNERVTPRCAHRSLVNIGVSEENERGRNSVSRCILSASFPRAGVRGVAHRHTSNPLWIVRTFGICVRGVGSRGRIDHWYSRTRVMLLPLSIDDVEGVRIGAYVSGPPTGAKVRAKPNPGSTRTLIYMYSWQEQWQSVERTAPPVRLEIYSHPSKSNPDLSETSVRRYWVCALWLNISQPSLPLDILVPLYSLTEQTIHRRSPQQPTPRVNRSIRSLCAAPSRPPSRITPFSVAHTAPVCLCYSHLLTISLYLARPRVPVHRDGYPRCAWVRYRMPP